MSRSSSRMRCGPAAHGKRWGRNAVGTVCGVVCGPALASPQLREPAPSGAGGDIVDFAIANDFTDLDFGAPTTVPCNVATRGLSIGVVFEF